MRLKLLSDCPYGKKSKDGSIIKARPLECRECVRYYGSDGAEMECFSSCRNCSKHNSCQDLQLMTLHVPRHVREKLDLWRMVLDATGAGCKNWGW